MKKHLILTCVLAIAIALGSVVVSAQGDFSSEYINSNSNAPANYDANLKKGDRAVAATGDSYLEVVRIVAKSGGIYKTTNEEGSEGYFKANSVYPYFDLKAFEQIVGTSENLLSRYLECYAKKHNLDFEKLQGSNYGRPFEVNAAELKSELDAEQTKLAQMETRLRQFTPRPETFMPPNSNPALWYEIASQRAEYIQCAVGERKVRDVKDSPWLMAYRLDTEKSLKAVNAYEPGSGDSMQSGMDVAFYAVSLKMRNAWLKEKNALDFKDEIDKVLKPLAEALAKKLPTYFPKTSTYAVRNAADESLMKRVLPNTAQQKIFAIGFAQSAWQIDKGTLGIPQARYKNGLIYRRDSNADHPYCYVTYVNIIQNYAGGGTYAASRSEIIREELVACPAGK